MPDQVLIAYATRAGSTAGVAEAIGATLNEMGLPARVAPVGEVDDVSPYRAVVTGSAIRGANWLPEAIKFVENHREVLSHKPFAAFMVCMTLSMADAGKYRDGLRDWLSPVRALVKPISEGYFAGALDFHKVTLTPNTLLMRAVVLGGLWSKGDHRDWAAIRDWTENLRPLLTE